MLSVQEFEKQVKERKVDQYFDPSFLQSAKAVNKRNKSKLIYMHVDDFLALARKGHGDHKEERVASMLEEGMLFPDLPYLWVDIVATIDREYVRRVKKGYCQVIAHEGRHRTRAMKALGFTHVPVVIHTTNALNLQWHATKERPKWVKSEDGYMKYIFTEIFPET